MAPMLVGIAFEVLALYYRDFTMPELPAFAFFISIWGLTLHQYWTRIEQITAMKWNMIGTEEKTALKDEARYHFYGTAVKSHINGKDSVYFRSSKRTGLYFVSTILICIVILICLATTAALFYVRHIIQGDSNIAPYADWITPAMMSLQITIANRVLYTVAAVLTEGENHRLEADHDFALTGNFCEQYEVYSFESLILVCYVLLLCDATILNS